LYLQEHLNISKNCLSNFLSVCLSVCCSNFDFYHFGNLDKNIEKFLTVESA
jgi:hypothetical protein